MDKMNKLLKYASENIPYFIEYFAHNNKDPLKIDSYPILCRKDYIDNYELMISQQYDKTQLMLNSTSGTTGMPLNVLRTQKEYYKQLLALWRIRKNYYNIVPSSLCLRFCLSKEEAKHAQKGIYSEDDNEIVVSLFDLDNEINTDNILKVFNDKKPKFIKATPTAICKFIMLNKKNGVASCDFISYIESTSEYLFDFQREMMSDFFCKAHISNEYGCTEIFGIAQEIPHVNGLKVLDENVYVEICTDNNIITREENIEGDLIITGLNSFSMPFIRYRIGDRGKFVNCGVHNNVKAIEVIAGRTNDYITYSNGQKEHCVILARTIQECNERSNQIVKFKFVQNTLYSFDLFLTIKNPKIASNVEQVFRSYIKQTNLKDFIWNLHFVDFDDYNQKKSKFSYFETKIIPN